MGGFMSGLKERKARKAHECICGAAIAPGDYYGTYTTMGDLQEDAPPYSRRVWAKYKVCDECMARAEDQEDQWRWSSW
jgi:hypothetical protein